MEGGKNFTTKKMMDFLTKNPKQNQIQHIMTAENTKVHQKYYMIQQNFFFPLYCR